MNYWERWVGDWKRKTAHLSAELKGIYGELLDHVYATEAPLPEEFEECCRIAGAITDSERSAVRRIVAEFFPERMNRRAAAEIERRKAYVETQRGLARRRWEHARAKEKAHKGNGAKPPQPEDPTPIIARIPILGGEEWPVHESLASELARLYPAVDVPQTLAEIRGWCIGNPTKLKTPRGVRKFIVSWLAREQDRHG